MQNSIYLKYHHFLPKEMLNFTLILLIMNIEKLTLKDFVIFLWIFLNRIMLHIVQV